MNKANFIVLAFAASIAASSVSAWAGPASGFGGAMGNWSRDDGNAKVKLEPCGKSLCAINTWIRDPASSEKVGDRLVMDLKPSGADVWKGSAFDPQRQRTYAMTMTLASGKLETRGCVLGGILCRSVNWTRIR